MKSVLEKAFKFASSEDKEEDKNDFNKKDKDVYKENNLKDQQFPYKTNNSQFQHDEDYSHIFRQQ